MEKEKSRAETTPIPGFIPTYGNRFRFRQLSANELSETCGSCVKAVFVVKTGNAVGRNNGDIKSMERLVNVSEGAYSSISFPMIQNASYAIECSISGRRQLIVTVDIVVGNEEYAEGKHSFEVLESPAGIMLYERKETDYSDVTNPFCDRKP